MTLNNEQSTDVQTEQTTTFEAEEKQVFKLTPPQNLTEIFASICTKRARKLIYAPRDVLFEATFKVLGTDKKNDEGIKIKDILEAEIKAGEKLGYLQKYDGLKSSEIKEEYENDVVYEYAEQQFKKAGIVADGDKLKVYVYDWDGQACHHVGYLDTAETSQVVGYIADREAYSFDVCLIITGGKGKKVTKDESGKITVEKIKDGQLGLELDLTIIPRKD